MKSTGRNDRHEMEYSQITENIFIGSDFCEGLVCPMHGPEFEKLGICGEINLEVERVERPPKNIDAYLWLPVMDGTAPTLDQLMIGSAMINEMVNLGNKIYVHCKNGHGRSPTMVAGYLIRYKNMSVEEATEFIKAKRPEIHIEDVQKEALKSLCK